MMVNPFSAKNYSAKAFLTVLSQIKLQSVNANRISVNNCNQMQIYSKKNILQQFCNANGLL